jgi:hypothetical protein
VDWPDSGGFDPVKPAGSIAGMENWNVAEEWNDSYGALSNETMKINNTFRHQKHHNASSFFSVA